MQGFSSHLFWDCDRVKLDPKRHARFIIGRVLARGTWADWQELKRRYPTDRLRDEVIRIRVLDRKSLAFCSAIFKIPREEFRCTKQPSSSPAP